MVVVLVVAAGAAWESPVLELIGARAGMVVLKRCVDVDELLAISSAGQADAAVVALDAPGLDPTAVDVLHRHQVRVVAVGPDSDKARLRAARAGVDVLLADDDLTGLPDLLEAEVDSRSSVGGEHPSTAAVDPDDPFDPADEVDPAGDLTARPGRNQLTLGALDVADEVLVVGSADPVGLSRLARGLVDLRERQAAAPVRVVVNRMRPGVGWTERDIAGMVEGFARLAGVHFLPDDQPAADRALTTGASVVDAGDSELARALTAVADAVAPPPAPRRRAERRRLPRPASLVRTRRAGTTRRR